jgi:transcriptional regulator with GAF, ATPase, and Fis domain
MPICFVFRIPEEEEYFWAVEDSGVPSTMTIGRDPSCEVPIPPHLITASRLHARLIRGIDGCWIENLGSKNLTWVDGMIVPFYRRIVLPCVLRMGNVDVAIDREDVEPQVLARMDPVTFTGLSDGGLPQPTVPAGDIDWRTAVEAMGFTLRWASAFFDISQLIAEASHPEQLRLTLQQALTRYLGATEIRLSFDVFPDCPESALKRFAPKEELRKRIRALSTSNPLLFDVSRNGRHITWAVLQSHVGASRIAVASGDFTVDAAADAQSEEARWLVLTTLQTAMPAVLRLRQLAAYEAVQPLTLPEPPSEQTLAAAKLLNIRGTSKAFHECLWAAEIAATRYFDFNLGDSSLKVVLLLGEIGSGKSVLAQLIHRLSSRREKEFFEMNAANIVSTLAEMELFGMAPGFKEWPEREGLFGEANGSTLFLDEIGNLHPSTQDKLLTVLTTGKYQRVGEPGATRKTNAYVIMAANQDLDAMAADGRFKPDLLTKMRMFTIHVPPIRERKEEISPQISDELKKICENNPGCELDSVSESLMDAFLDYDWPYNFRELLEILRSAAICAPLGTRTIDWGHLRPHHRECLLKKRQVILHSQCDVGLTWKDNEEALEREYLAQLLGVCEGNFGQMKERAKLAPGTLNGMEERMQEYLRTASSDEVARIRGIAGKGWRRIDPGEQETE